MTKALNERDLDAIRSYSQAWLARVRFEQGRWDEAADPFTPTVKVTVSRLRRKLDPEGRRFVVNVWGYGYRLLHGPESSAPAGELSVNGVGW